MDSMPGKEAPTARNAGKLGKTAAYYASFVTLGMVAAVIGPSLGRLAEQTQTSLGMFSYIFIARSLGYLIGSLVGGHLSDRLPAHWVIAADLVVMAVTLGLIPVVSWFWLLLLVMFILGTFSGALDVGGNTLLVWVHRDKSGPYMNGLHLFFGLGAFISPVILAQVIAKSGGIAWGYWILALLALPVLLSVILQSSPAPIAQKGDRQTGKANLLLVGLIIAFFFFYVGAEHAMGDWIASYARRMNLADEVNAAYLASFFWAALTIGRLLAIPITARLRPRYVLLTDLAGCLVSVGVMLIFPHSLLGAQIGTWGLGLAMASVFPTMLTFAGNRMVITGRITSFFFVGASLGGMFQPWLIGRLFEPVGPRVAPFSILVSLLLALVLLVVMIRTTAVPTHAGELASKNLTAEKQSSGEV
jgi:FHS family Na+ dependent glucose MFS transporter 1